MRFTLRPFVIMAILAWVIVFAGCGRGDSKPKNTPALPDTTYAAPAPRRGDVDRTFLDTQLKRADQVQQEITQLKQARPRDNAKIRELVVKRKGEVLNAKKMVRESTQLTAEQKTLMLSKLDEESIDLAQELVAVSQ